MESNTLHISPLVASATILKTFVQCEVVVMSLGSDIKYGHHHSPFRRIAFPYFLGVDVLRVLEVFLCAYTLSPPWVSQARLHECTHIDLVGG